MSVGIDSIFYRNEYYGKLLNALYHLRTTWREEYPKGDMYILWEREDELVDDRGGRVALHININNGSDRYTVRGEGICNSPIESLGTVCDYLQFRVDAKYNFISVRATQAVQLFHKELNDAERALTSTRVSPTQLPGLSPRNGQD